MMAREISLPLDYEKAYKEAKDKLQWHTERAQHHAVMAKHYAEQVEELEPLTDTWERSQVRAEKERKNSKEFQEIRKKVKKKGALTLVDRMLAQIAEEGI